MKIRFHRAGRLLCCAVWCLLAATSIAQESTEKTSRSSVLELLKQGEEVAAQIKDDDGAASAYWSIGALLLENEADAEAAKLLAVAREKAFLVKDRMRRWELVEIIAKDEAKAGGAVNLDGYLERAENDAQKSAVVSATASGYFERGDKEKARALFDRAWKMAQKISGPYKEVFFLSLADDASRAGDLDTAKEFYARFKDYVHMLGGEAEYFGMRKLGEAQLEANLKEDALNTFSTAAKIAMEGNAPEDAGEIAGLMAAAGFTAEAEQIIAKFIEMLEKWEPAAERPGLTALLADTLNREGVFPNRVMELLSDVSADDRAYLLPEAAMNLASSGDPVAAEKLLPRISEAEDQISVMCAISDAWGRKKDSAKSKDWVTRALATARTINEQDVRREVLLEVAEQQLSAGLEGEAKKTWKEVASAGEQFRRAIQEREFFQLVEAHEWDAAMAALAAMADSPDISVLQSGLATELAKEGQLERAIKLAGKLPDALPAKLEIVRLGYEKLGSTLDRKAIVAELKKHSDPEVIVSLIIGHVGGFRRVAEAGQ